DVTPAHPLPVKFQPFKSSLPPVKSDNDFHDMTEVHDITPTQSTMTLEDTERETIRRSLERNGGRRKATAQELNISERPLYRKIKEYGIE
ncbi:MAG: helix-turn-helix domain-containing protein, partial [Duncaniella sp.]|nr:helix-turn-helix domain-containing protein [Duncaniella sp.]